MTPDSTAAGKQWQVTCQCGWRTRGTEGNVVEAVQAHARTAHQLEITPEQVMAQAVAAQTP